MKNLNKVRSFKVLENEESGTYQKERQSHNPNYFTVAEQRKHNGYSQKSFQLIFTGKRQKSPEQESFLKKLNDSNYFYLNNSETRKPLDNLLKSKQNILKCSSKQFKERILRSNNEKIRTKLKYQNTKPYTAQQKNQLQNKYHNKYPQVNSFDNYKTTIKDNLELNRLRDNVQMIKTMKQENRRKSRSNSKKGLQCTLYERSLQKKINQLNVKQKNKLICIKSKYQTTEKQMGEDKQAQQKDIKKILLKRKTPETSIQNSNCFKSVIIQKRKSRLKKSNSISKVSGLTELYKSLSLINKNIKAQALNQSNNKNQSKEKRRSQSKNKNESIKRIKTESFDTQKKVYDSTKFNQIQRKLFDSQKKGKRITVNQKIERNLQKIHLNYKFILNYLSDFDIIGKFNGYELAGQAQCKWILLVIDQVYDMIKHADQTKLKGMQYTREYQYKNIQNEALCQQLNIQSRYQKHIDPSSDHI